MLNLFFICWLLLLLCVYVCVCKCVYNAKYTIQRLVLLISRINHFFFSNIHNLYCSALLCWYFYLFYFWGNQIHAIVYFSCVRFIIFSDIKWFVCASVCANYLHTIKANIASLCKMAFVYLGNLFLFFGSLLVLISAK